LFVVVKAVTAVPSALAFIISVGEEIVLVANTSVLPSDEIFTLLANTPSTTSLSLKVFLRTSHKNVPNFILKPEEADDIVAYIVSLRVR